MQPGCGREDRAVKTMKNLVRRWPVATSLFVLHAAMVALVYIWWAASSSVERGMIWMTVFLVDLPSSYLFVYERPDSMLLHAISAIFIGGLQWAIVGAVVDLLRRRLLRK
ncbi:MAG TPA: hypothetical protein VJS88_04045 [Chthoniobacterales bacterium]|nr:hypothetical protein [Chthoniobacterales bacterium]